MVRPWVAPVVSTDFYLQRVYIGLDYAFHRRGNKTMTSSENANLGVNEPRTAIVCDGRQTIPGVCVSLHPFPSSSAQSVVWTPISGEVHAFVSFGIRILTVKSLEAPSVAKLFVQTSKPSFFFSYNHCY